MTDIAFVMTVFTASLKIMKAVLVLMRSSELNVPLILVEKLSLGCPEFFCEKIGKGYHEKG